MAQQQDASSVVVESVSKYEKLHRVGEGTYGRCHLVLSFSGDRTSKCAGSSGAAGTGPSPCMPPPPLSKGVTYKAKDRSTGEVVALKKVRFDRWGWSPNFKMNVQRHSLLAELIGGTLTLSPSQIP